MICCWISTSNSMHMSYTLHATRWISDDLVLDFHIEFSAYVIQFKNIYGQSFFDSWRTVVHIYIYIYIKMCL
jgi:hypothetical protein